MNTICPYKDTSNNTCSNKNNYIGNRINSKKQKSCIFKNPKKCKIFMEWSNMKESITRMAENGLKHYTGDDI